MKSVLKMISAVLCAALIAFCMISSDGYAITKEYYLIPNANILEVHSLEGSEFKLIKKVPFEKIRNFAWPNYNKLNHDIYIEAESAESIHKTSYIYKYNANNNPNISISLEGRYPSLSPDGQWLAYYLHPNKLWIINLESRQTIKIADDINNYQPPVWVSNNRILYNSTTNQLVSLDIIKGEKLITGYKGVIPGALSPDGKRVLCTGSNKIYIYTVDTNSLETIKESNSLSIDNKVIWRPDGKSFLYLRQTWANQLRFSEGDGLFLFSLEGRAETLLLKQFHFFGGLEGDFEKILQPSK